MWLGEIDFRRSRRNVEEMGTDQGVDLFQTQPYPSRHCAHSRSILGRRIFEMTQHCGQLVPLGQLLMDRVYKLHAVLLAAMPLHAGVELRPLAGGAPARRLRGSTETDAARNFLIS